MLAAKQCSKLASSVRLRFHIPIGTIPDWVDQRLKALSAPEIEALALRVYLAKTVENLFG